MKFPLKSAFALVATASLAVPASAAVLVADNITYNLFETSVTNGGLTGNFVLVISGINTGADAGSGRTGVNAFAFNDAPFAVSGTSTGFTFETGGLNSSGCNGNGAGFFCFDNTGAVFADPLTGFLALTFSVTSDTVGSWADWDPSFKIDWSGSANNYDLVSLPIPVNEGPCIGPGCPVVTPTDGVPEPATWAMMLMGFGAAGYALRRRRKVLLTQVA